MKVLVIEDQYSLADAIAETLKKENFSVKIITEGEMISDFETYQCVISSELATLNEIEVGNTITLKNPNTEQTYDFTVTGIYTNNEDNNDSASMYSPTANTIITGSGVIELLVTDYRSFYSRA